MKKNNNNKYRHWKYIPRISKKFNAIYTNMGKEKNDNLIYTNKM